MTVLTSRAGDLAAESDDQGVRVVRVPVFFRRQLAVANFPSMLAYLPSGFARGLSLRARRRSTSSTRISSCRPGRWVTHSRAGIACPNVLSVHGGDLFDPSKRSSPHLHAPLRAAVRWMLAAADEVVGQSRDTVRHVNEIYGVRRDVGSDSARDRAPAGASRSVARDLRPACTMRSSWSRSGGWSRARRRRSSSTCWPRARFPTRTC